MSECRQTDRSRYIPQARLCAGHKETHIRNTSLAFKKLGDLLGLWVCKVMITMQEVINRGIRRLSSVLEGLSSRRQQIHKQIISMG